MYKNFGPFNWLFQKQVANVCVCKYSSYSAMYYYGDEWKCYV